MKKRLIVIFASVSVILSVAVAAVAVGSRPKVICVLQNPVTGERVEMYREAWFKVPANYDEKRHIEQWSAEQRGLGYTAEVANEK